MMSAELPEAIKRLQALNGLTVITDEPLAPHTSFGIGGPADLLVIPHETPALLRLRTALHDLGVKPTFLGNGTNVLVSDEGVRGVVVKLGSGLRGLGVAENTLVAGAGESLAAVCCLAADSGLAGLEFAAGIPGTVGGAVLMNAGAGEGEMAHVVEWVEIAAPAGELRRLSAKELAFGYRWSTLRDGPDAVCRVGLHLVSSTAAQVHRRLCEVIERRCAKQPVAQASAGCIFKRPEGDYAGRLVEAVNGKGLRVGKAAISTKHANFIVNLGGARARDVLALIRLVQARVREEFGVDLETEICLLGEHSLT